MKTTYISGNTSEGFYSLAGQFWQGDTEVWLITGSSMLARGTVLLKLADRLGKYGAETELFVHPDDGKTPDGLCIPAVNLVILADNEAALPASRYSGLADQTINLNDCLKTDHLRKSRGEIFALQEEAATERQAAYRHFKNGRVIHEEKEAVYLKAMDFSKADQAADEIIAKWIEKASVDGNVGSKTAVRFFGAATAFGPLNFIDELTKGINKRIIIKGRSGSGKSTLMRKVAQAAEEKQLYVEYYPCGLDPKSLDMVFIPELSFAILDGTAPHVIDPRRKEDEVVDMFERCMDPLVEDVYSRELREYTANYKDTMKKGTACLSRVNQIQQQINQYYDRNTDYNKIDNLVSEIESFLHMKLTAL
ncbi:hypothetical protein [Evansella clarkii]|uniref:hypothetical protein n=1 Tax=Evansella clarkii TaxID=79879 RepID=UPI000B452DD7|nr:hypothetical protein [Evansella clarkii]